MVPVFVGTKMLIADSYKIPVGLSLGIVSLIIASFMFASLWAAETSRPRLMGQKSDLAEAP